MDRLVLTTETKRVVAKWPVTRFGVATQIFTSWNQIAKWLSRLDVLRLAA